MGSKGCWEEAEIDRIASPLLMHNTWSRTQELDRFRCTHCGTTFNNRMEKCPQCGARDFEVTR